MRRWLIPILLTLGLFADWMLLNWLHQQLGFALTLLIVVAFIPWGLYLQFSQGAAIRDQLIDAFRTGHRIPETALEGVMVMLGGVMMIVPGVISSLMGLVMVLPFTRRMIRPLIAKGLSLMLPPEVQGVASGASVFGAGMPGSGVPGSGVPGSGVPRSGAASGRAAGFGSTGFGADVVDANPRRPRPGPSAGGTSSRPGATGRGGSSGRDESSGRAGTPGRKSIDAEVLNIERNDRPGA